MFSNRRLCYRGVKKETWWTAAIVEAHGNPPRPLGTPGGPGRWRRGSANGSGSNAQRPADGKGLWETETGPF